MCIRRIEPHCLEWLKKVERYSQNQPEMCKISFNCLVSVCVVQRQKTDSKKI